MLLVKRGGVLNMWVANSAARTAVRNRHTFRDFVLDTEEVVDAKNQIARKAFKVADFVLLMEVESDV